MRMRKMMVLPGVALGALALGAAGGSASASAAGNYHFGAPASHLARSVAEDDVDGVDDDDDDDDDGEDTTSPSNGGGEEGAASGSGSGELPLTGGNASGVALLGAMALATGGAMHRVSKRRAGLETADVTAS